MTKQQFERLGQFLNDVRAIRIGGRDYNPKIVNFCVYGYLNGIADSGVISRNAFMAMRPYTPEDFGSTFAYADYVLRVLEREVNEPTP